MRLEVVEAEDSVELVVELVVELETGPDPLETRTATAVLALADERVPIVRR